MINDGLVKESIVVFRHLENRSSNEPFRYTIHCTRKTAKNRNIKEEAMIQLQNDINNYCEWLTFLAGDWDIWHNKAVAILTEKNLPAEKATAIIKNLPDNVADQIFSRLPVSIQTKIYTNIGDQETQLRLANKINLQS